MVLVHTKVFVPFTKPVTPLVGELGVVTVAVPAVTVQAPVPVVIVLPARVAVAAHTVWSGPAAAVVGEAVRVIVTASLVVGQIPLLLVHRKVFVPFTKPVTPLVGELGVVTEAVPAVTVQVPVPGAAIALPARVAVVVHTV